MPKKKKRTWGEGIDELHLFVRKHNRTPKRAGAAAGEKSLAFWVGNQCNARNISGAQRVQLNGILCLVQPAVADVARIAALREELAGMKMKPLKVRALEAGVTQDQLDVADDEDDAKGVIVELVLQHAAFATEAAAAHVGIAGM